MIDNFEFSPNPPASSGREPNDSADPPVAINLPLDLAEAIAQRMQQTGQTQTQVILAALRLAFSQKEVASHSAAALEDIKQRLAELESLIPKVTVLEGKLIAF
ncbi:MAG TPA: hypothetical protein V6C57_24580, partial [Coleofasciculaceae cyanobacterium]